MSPEHRVRYVGSSEVASLFGFGRISRFELWHRKNGTLPEEDISGWDRVFWGQTLEPAIARGAAEREGLQIAPARFVEHPVVEGMGCHPDYRIVNERPGILEVKNVDALVFRDWEDGEPPPHFELQLQHQLACTGLTWGLLAVLVGGNALHVIRREARPGAIRRIEQEIATFWRSIREGQEPEPEWECDLPTLAKLYGHAEPGKVLDLRDHSQANALVGEYIVARETAKLTDTAKDAIKAKLLPILGDCERAILGDGVSISRKEIAETEVNYTRKSYRDFRITRNSKFALVAKQNGG